MSRKYFMASVENKKEVYNQDMLALFSGEFLQIMY